MRYIKYIGPAHVRQITAAEWRQVGINGETVQWNAWNGFSVPADQLTDEQIRRAIEPDQYFIITGDEDEAPKMVSPAMTGETAQGPVVDTVALMDGADVSTATVDGPKGDVDDRTPASTTGGAPSGTKASR